MSRFNGIGRGRGGNGLTRRSNTPETPETPAEIRDNTLIKLGEARIMGNTIYNELSSINFNEVKKDFRVKNANFTKYADGLEVAVTGEQMADELQTRVNTILHLLKKEDPTKIVVLDTERIDGKLHYFSQMLSSALSNGDLNTAEVCTLAVLYGVIEGHKPIPSTVDLTEKNSELKKREERIDMYSTMVDTAKEIGELEKTKGSIKSRYANEVLPKYIAARAKLEKDMEKNSSVYETIAGKDPKTLKGVHLEAWKNTATVDNFYDIGEAMEKQVGLIDDNVKRYEENIIVLKNALDNSNIRNNVKLQMNIDRAMNTIPGKMNELLNSSINQREIFRKFSGQIDEVFANPELITSMVMDSQKFEMIKREEKEKEEQLRRDKEASIKKLEESIKKLEDDDALDQKIKALELEKLEKELELERKKNLKEKEEVKETTKEIPKKDNKEKKIPKRK